MKRRVGERFYAEGTNDLLEVVKAERNDQCEGCYYNLKEIVCLAVLEEYVGECWDRPENNDIVKFIKVK